MPLSPPHVTDAPPPFPEAALRAILAGTVAAWAAAELPSAEDEPRRIYVDAFAGSEFQFGTGVARSGDEETRAAAAFRALDGASSPAPMAVLAEEDPAHLGRIYAELEDAAGGERLRATHDLASLAAGEITLLEAPFASVAGDVGRFAMNARAFAFLAPPAARALPWPALRAMLSLPDATVLVRLPHSDFEKQTKHTSPLADLPGFAKRIVEGCSAMLDDGKHAWLAAWRADAASKGFGGAMEGVLERFRALLDGASNGRILKPMELETAEGARTWLFLLTPDPAVALAANAAVRAAKLVDRAASANPIATATPSAGVIAPPPVEASTSTTSKDVPAEGTATSGDDAEPSAKPSRKRGKKGPAKKAALDDVDSSAAESAESAEAAEAVASTSSSAVDTEAAAPTSRSVDERQPEPLQPPRNISHPARGSQPAPVAEVLDLFGEQPKAGADESALPDPAALASSIEARFAASTVAWREILRAFAATDVTPAELKAALALLRRGGRATYKSLKADDDAVDFPAESIAREKPKPREKPKRRAKAAADDGLFGSVEGDGEAEGEDGEA